MNLVFVGLLGLLFCALGLRMRLGYMKGLYLVQGFGAAMPAAVKYTFLPLGVCLLALELAASNLIPLEQTPYFFNRVVSPMLIITFVLGIWQPNWLLPYWLQYLRKTYGIYGTDRLLDGAGDPEWFEKVKTHEGLVQWAEEKWRILEAERVQQQEEWHAAAIEMMKQKENEDRDAADA